MTALVLTLCLVGLLIIGVPAAFSLVLAPWFYLLITRGWDAVPYEMLAQRTVYGLDSFPLLAIPLFLFVGRISNESGLTHRLFDFANALVGHFRAGLVHVNVLASVIFAGMSGAATADAAGLGSIEIEAMTKNGYDLDFSAAVTAASSLIGPIIPPSIPVVLYAILAQESVNALLIAGIIPGLLMAVSLMLFIMYQTRNVTLKQLPPQTLGQIWTAFRRAFLALMTPVILIGGILSGAFTATEAAAVAGAYGLFLTTVVYRTVNARRLWELLQGTLLDSATIMFILGTANIYTWLLTRARVPQMLSDGIFALTQNYWVIMALSIGILLLSGAFVSSTVSINLFTPILVPLVLAVGGDAVHFGMVMIVTLMIGELTPPFGMVLFAIMRVTGMTFERLVRAVAPYLIPIFAVLLVIVVFPGLVTWLPRVLLH